MVKSIVDHSIDFVWDAHAWVGKSLNKLRRWIMKTSLVGWVASKIEDKITPNQDELIDKAKNKLTGKIKEAKDALWSNVSSYLKESTKNKVNEIQEEVEILTSINKDLEKIKIYNWANKKDVIKATRSLPNKEYRKLFWEALKTNNIEGIQKELNKKISDWDWDEEMMKKYKEFLKSQNISLNKSHRIAEDWKLWPQTMATLKFVSENRSIIHWANGVIKKISKGYKKILDKNQEKADTNNQSGKKVEKKMIKNKKRKRRRR